jgi:3,4-dihydroxy 2-butanone 4-phosphate synthase/GTP cyclohydrolase II
MSKIFGTTLYIASSNIQTRYGFAIAHTFQDLISREYSLVLTFGSINQSASKPILARIHSSCLTSETLRAFDSDDVQQLEGALAAIKNAGRGILYYFIQEGRGAGFISKAKDRMLVQANPKLTSHKAFNKLGLRSDYRSYDRIRDINHLLKINAPLMLLTNNPDKFKSLKSLGVKIKKSIPLEIKPTSHSAAYLQSKKLKGHLLKYKSPKTKALLKAPVAVKPFEPYHVPGAQRFVHAASYQIPIKPVNGALFLSEQIWHKIYQEACNHLTQDQINKIFVSIHTLAQNRVEVRIDRNQIRGAIANKNKISNLLGSILEIPYWFTLHAYWDISSGEEFIVLEHISNTHSNLPIPVRIQSESLFNRFPLEDMSDRDKFKKSLYQIAKEDKGLIVLLHNDGRGAGFGALAMEKMICQKDPCLKTEDVYTRLGLAYDLRDYSAAALLVKHHLRDQQFIKVLTSSAASVRKKPESVSCFTDAGIKVANFCYLDSQVELPEFSSDFSRLLK